MRTQNWKNVERQAAKLFGGTRTGCNGESRRDIEHHDLSIEVKHRKTLPDWIHKAMEQADDVLVLHRSQGAISALRRLKFLREEVLGKDG